jgi:SAM-dependent methyltransferase
VRNGFYRQTARVERLHWWFVHRRRLADALVRGRDGLEAGRRVLDVGCGSGGNLEWLGRSGWRAVGLDRSPLALELARAALPGAAIVRAGAQDLGHLFRPASFSLVTVFNVLYHAWVPSESVLLGAVRSVLEPGGFLLLTEPAFGFLRRRHDDVDLGARRYTRRGIERLVADAGFEIVASSYFNTLAFAPALLAAALDRLRRPWARAGEDETAEIAVPPRAINRALIALCALERTWIARGGRMPVGVGVIVLARAPGGPGPRAQVGT